MLPCAGLKIGIEDRTNRSAGTRSFHGKPSRSSEAVCELVLALKQEGLICGFIAEVARDCLAAAGIDVRIGSCVRRDAT